MNKYGSNLTEFRDILVIIITVATMLTFYIRTTYDLFSII